MIPAAVITAWARERPWPNRAAIEQDLLLAGLITRIYTHPFLRDELVFRGGTCLHQLHLPAARRYSEDLDFVRRTHSGVGRVFDALRDVAADTGLEVRSTDTGVHPKVTLRTRAEHDPNIPLRIKIEINTHETSPALDLIRLPFTVGTAWYTGHAGVLTFQPPELVATKLRALYQRKKGRDLFDLWLALTELNLNPDTVLAAYHPYRPAGHTAAAAIDNLHLKLADTAFRTDLDPLVASWPDGYDIDTAAQLIEDKLLAHLV